MKMLKDSRSRSTQYLYLKRISGLFLITLFLVSAALGEILQTVNFEAPTGYSASPAETNTNGDNPDYWIRTNGTTPVIYPSVPFSNQEGSYFFAAEDLDYDGRITPHYVTCDAVSIAGYSNIQVKILVAGRGLSGGKEGEEFLKIQYQYDGGGFTTASQFLGNNDYYSLDADADGVVDGADINETMSEFTFDLPSSGTSLQVRIYVYCGGGEELAFDDIRVLGVEAPLPVELSSFAAENQDGSVLLTWITESETENLGFVLEKRTSGNTIWDRIADYINDSDLNGNGTTNETHHYNYIDSDVTPGLTYEYRLAEVDFSGDVSWLETIEISTPEERTDLLTQFYLKEAYPNPFNPTTTISYDLAASADVKIIIRDINGRNIQEWAQTNQAAGSYTLTWNAHEQSSGVYIFQMITNGFMDNKKMVLLK